MSGLLIVLEGPEGAGKSTQLRRLAGWMTAGGAEVVAVREPGGTVLGDEIRRLLLDPASEIVPAAEALLFMASRAQLVECEIRPALARGAVVLLDRFFLSTYAYQVAGRGLADEAIRAANALATRGLVPDLTLLLTLPVEEGLARAGRRDGGVADRMEREARDFHQRVATAFGEFAGAGWQARHAECGPIVEVDARQPEERVFERVRSEIVGRWPGSFPMSG